MKSIQNYHLNGKKVLLRVDFNVPQDENLNVTDTTRISAVKPTIDKIISDGGSIILMTHLGRPKGVISEKYSLKNIIPEIEEILERKIQFSENSIGEDVKILSNELKDGQILLLENLRFHEEEELGDENFAKELSHLGDIYVNDAFGTAHRKHASTAVIAQFFPETKFFGLLMAKELEAIDKVLKNGKKPITAVLGGSKVSSKITIIENILPVVDNLIIGGGMSFTFVKAQGGSIGTSIVEEDKLDLALDILQTAKNLGVNIFLPVDVICADEFSNTANTKEVDIYDIPENWMGMDAGPKTRLIFHDVILSSKTILWNGPLGVFEMENFANGTISLGESIEEATLQGAFSLVGGGDSVSFVKSNGFDDKVSYVSTGGGAMLESLEGLELPGVAAINS